MRSRLFVLSAALALAACGGDPVVPVDATVDADLTDALDLTPPDTMITAAPAALTNQTTARFEFTASESATFRCRIDGGAWATCTSPRMFSALTDGQHTFEVAATDTSDLEDPSPATHTWRVDTRPPDTVITGQPEPIDNSVDATFTFEAPGETGATFECSLDTAAFAACTSPAQAMGLADGNHAYRVRAKDEAGNIDPSPARFEWQINSAAPDTSIDSGPAGTVASRSATFTFSSPNAGAGATFACRLDNTPFGPCTSPRTYPGLLDGAHSFEVKASDMLGNTDPSAARRQWTIDATGPVTTITLRPDNPTGDLTPDFEFNANEAATFECQIDGQVPYAPCTSPYHAPMVPGGTRFFRVRATDMLGNRGADATYEWLIDSFGPSIAITSGPSGPVASTSATFNWSSTEPSTFCYRFTGDAADTCTMALSGSGTVTRMGLAQGAQTFTVTATDALGNTGPVATRNFTVDTVGPSVSITAGPAANATVGTIANAFTFASTEASTYCHKVDNGSELCTATPAMSTTVTVNTLDGAHTLEVVARDTLGNRTAPPVTRSWTVDTVRPTVSITAGPAAGTSVDSVDATLDLSASESSTICWRINGGAETCSAAGQMSFSAMLTGLPQGTATFAARAQDAIGFGPVVTRQWIVDNVRPTVSITAGPAQNSLSGSKDVIFTITSSEAARICWSFNGGAEACSAAGATVATATRGNLPEGANTFDVKATDAIGDGATVSRSWNIDSVRPAITITAGPGAGSTTDVPSPTFMVSSSEAATICWRFNGGAEVCSAAGQLTASATPAAPLADGGALFEVYGRDGIAVGATSARSWRIDTVRPTVAITAGPAANSTLGSASATVTLTASEASTICWQFTGKAMQCTAAGATSATASTTGLADGAITFTATAADAVAAGAQTTRSWTVDTVRPTVSFSAGSPAEAARINATTASYTINASEASTICWRLDGGAETCSAAGANTFDAMLAGLAQGNHSILVYARDLVGTGASLARTFITDSLRPEVAITAGPAEGATQSGTTVNFQVTASEPSTICWRFDGGGQTCSAANQTLAAPSANALAAGAHSLEVWASDPIGEGVHVTRNWTVDLVRPTVTITAGPAQSSITGANNSQFTVTSSEPATICWRINNAAQTLCSNPGVLTHDILTGPLPDGGSTLAVEGRDAFGAGTTLVRNWTIDTVRPTVTITSGPAENALTNQTSESFGLSTVEPAQICWSFNGGAETCSANGVKLATASAAGLPDGVTTLSVRARDGVGFGTPTVRHWTIDSTPPVISFAAGPADGALTNQTAAAFTINTNEPSRICWTRDGAGPATCSALHVMTFNANLAGLSAGVHTLSVTADDDASNPATVTRTWTIDLTAPTITITGGPAENASTNADFANFTLGTNEAATICWNVDGGANTCSAAGQVSFPANLSGLAPGNHTLNVTATDTAGNPATATRHWNIDNAAPMVAISAPPAQNSVTNATTASFTITSNKASTICWALDGGAQTCSAAGVMMVSTGNLTSLAAGNHALVAIATDAATNQTTVTRNWSIDLTAPTITISTPPAQNGVTNATTANFTLTSSEGATICWALDAGAQTCSGAGVLNFGTGNLVGLTAGAHALVVTATDTATNVASLTRNWTIDTTAPTVTISTPPAEGGNSASNVSFTLTTNEQADICWKLDMGANTCTGAGATTATASLTGLSLAMHTLTVTGTDAAGNLTTATRTWTVNMARQQAGSAADPIGPSLYDGVVSGWVRDPGLAGGAIMRFAAGAGTCTLRGAQAIVALECEVDGVALAPAYGFLGSLASDGAWHFVTIAFDGDRLELWIDDQLADATALGGTGLGAAGLALAGVASMYAVDGLSVDLR